MQALQRPDNKPLSDEYYERLHARTNELAQNLGNEAQRQLFQQRAGERLTQFRGNLMNYEGQENTNYQLSVASGTVATASREMAAFYNDPALEATIREANSAVDPDEQWTLTLACDMPRVADAARALIAEIEARGTSRAPSPASEAPVARKAAQPSVVPAATARSTAMRTASRADGDSSGVIPLTCRISASSIRATRASKRSSQPYSPKYKAPCR